MTGEDRMAKQVMRAQFEAWHRSVVDGDPPHEKYNNGDYRNQHVQRYWIGWQASREAVEVDFSSVREEADNHCFGGEEAVFHSAVKAIEAQGLKVKS